MRNMATGAWRAGTLGLVAVVAVANVVSTAQKTPPPPVGSPAGPNDPVMRQERRFAELRAGIRDRGLGGAAGYLGDLPASRLLADARGVEGYYLAQFALAPLVLDLDAERHEWIVVNLQDPAGSPKVPSGWRVEQDYGRGVRLLRKAPP